MMEGWSTLPKSGVPKPFLILLPHALFMPQTIHTPVVGGENFAGLKIISCSSSDVVMGCKEHASLVSTHLKFSSYPEKNADE